jgi:hypothetical protein
MNTDHSWVKTYHDAILETDWTRMEERIEAAEVAIRVRRHEFSLNHGGTPEENQDIEDALYALNVLRKEVGAWLGSKRTG